MRGRIAWAIGALVTAALVSGGCAGDDEATPASDCAADADCDDGNPCTEGGCTATGTCSFGALPDGVAPQQTPHDCLQDWCEAGQAVTVEDATDRPPDEPCRIHECVGTSLESTTLTEGEACEIDGDPGTCTAEGLCDPGCLNDDVCDDDNACTVDSCDLVGGDCTYDPLDNVLAPGSQQTAGDCLVIMCQDGNVTSIIDDEDLPDDGNECTHDVCTGMTPSNPPVADGTPCNGGNGQCQSGVCT